MIIFNNNNNSFADGSRCKLCEVRFGSLRSILFVHRISFDRNTKPFLKIQIR